MMNKLIPVAVLLFVCCCISSAQAEDELVRFSIKQALENERVRQALVNDIALYWGDQSYAAPVKNFGKFKTTKRTNAFGKGRESACQWALASALKVLQERALIEGANAVVNIKSNIKNKEMSSSDLYECLAGSMMVNVALKGTVVQLAK